MGGGTMERGMRLRYDVMILEKPIYFTRLFSLYLLPAYHITGHFYRNRFFLQ